MFKNYPAKMISDASHFENEPCAKTIKQKGKKELIDYELAFDSFSETIPPEHYEEVKDNEEIMKNLFS